jgi:hypothetical protein
MRRRVCRGLEFNSGSRWVAVVGVPIEHQWRVVTKPAGSLALGFFGLLLPFWVLGLRIRLRNALYNLGAIRASLAAVGPPTPIPSGDSRPEEAGRHRLEARATAQGAEVAGTKRYLVEGFFHALVGARERDDFGGRLSLARACYRNAP